MTDKSVTRTAGVNRRHKPIHLTVNGCPHTLRVSNRAGDVAPEDTLVRTLRETMGLTGTKVSCDRGACGCCTVLLDGKAVPSCTILTIDCDGKTITTIEGLADPVTGALSPLQQAFVDHTAFQCGFCTPGMILSAQALLDENPAPTEADIREALAGNFCRCISHYHVIDAVMAAATGGSDR